MASYVSFHLIFTRGIGGTVILPISQMGKLRLTEVMKKYAQGHTTIKCLCDSQ